MLICGFCLNDLLLFAADAAFINPEKAVSARNVTAGTEAKGSSCAPEVCPVLFS